jgi:adenosylmethionine-8-amino-7-oxononanoate aminotransferase
MERAVFYTGGTEALDCSLKLVRQFHIENGEPERVNFIGRDRSYHGNSLSTLALAKHRARRAPYEPLFAGNFHHVSPAYSYRYKRSDETEEDYVGRLATELEQKMVDLGPKTVAAFYAETSEIIIERLKVCSDPRYGSRGSHNRLCSSPCWILCGDKRSL